MMTTAEHLRAAKALIDTPEKWTRKVSARDKNLKPASASDKRACIFCSVGAVWRVFDGVLDDPAVLPCELCLERSLPSGFDDISAYNDDPDTTHPDIMSLFDRAIELAEAQADAS